MADGRVRLDLSGTWRFVPDPDARGLAEGWPVRGLPDRAVPAPVPGVWNTVLPGYVGAAFYEATFAAPPGRAGRAARFRFGGATYLTDAWLNGVHLGRHEGGYTPFAFGRGEALRDGSNRLVLRIVDPPAGRGVDGLVLAEAPTSKEAWYGGYGGPWGGVALELTDPIWVEHAALRWDEQDRVVRVAVELGSDYPERRHVMLAVELRGPDGACLRAGPFSVAVPPGGGRAQATVPVPEPVRWAPEQPALYEWTVIANASRHHRDALRGTFGLRTVALRDGRLLLNGEPRPLKGVLIQPVYPGSLVLPPDGLAVRDLELARAAGFTLVRSHLRPPPPGFLDRADRDGMLVYVESPLAWIGPSARLAEHGRREVEAMVRRDANHPSVVLWGLFNENRAAASAVGRELMAHLAALDPTRPIVDDSGGAAVGEAGAWAWAGQTRCWSPGCDAPRPLDDLHVYLAGPPRAEARRVMATLGAEPRLDVTPGRPAGERIVAELAGGHVLVSEYGVGGLPDFDAALASYAAARADRTRGDGDERAGPELTDAGHLRRLRADLERGLRRRGLLRGLGGVASVVRATQRAQAVGLAAQTAALRRNPRVGGYIVTQLADAGWEQMAGLAGAWRDPRPAHALMARMNRPRCLWIEPDDPCTSDRARVRAWLLQDPDLAPPAARATLTVSLAGPGSGPGFASAGALAPSDMAPARIADRAAATRTVERARVVRRSVRLGAGTTALGVLTVPISAPPGPYAVRASLAAGGWSDVADAEVLRLPGAEAAPRAEGVAVPTGWVSVWGRRLWRAVRRATPPDLLPSVHERYGPACTTEGEPATMPPAPAAILADASGALSRDVVRWWAALARGGGHVCLAGIAPRNVGHVAELFALPLALHGARGNFMGAYHYLRAHPLFAGLGAPRLADAAFAEVLPTWALAELPGADVLAGAFSVPDGGAAFDWRASVQTLAHGAGRVTFYQLDIGPAGGALGRYLLGRLVAWLAAPRPDPADGTGQGQGVKTT